MDSFLTEIHQKLGINETHLRANRLVLCEQPLLEHLRVVDIDFEGKPFLLHQSAALAWKNMKDAAESENIYMKPFSGFRSYLHQFNLIDKHLKNGRPLENILTHIAIPGFSEHHSGRAIDVHALDHPVLEEQFEQTQEFSWLRENAQRFQFRLSYPRANDFGIIYEPWHWFYSGR